MENPRRYGHIRDRLTACQTPWALVLDCIDSRVSPELIFDQGLGDLFTPRTAGQVPDNAVLGSAIFGVTEHVPLIVVLGHESCGAVKYAIRVRDGQTTPSSPHLAYLADYIRPSIDPDPTSLDREIRAVDANVRRILGELLGKPDISRAVARNELRVVGYRYNLTRPWNLVKL